MTKDDLFVNANDANNAVVRCANTMALGRSGSAPNLEEATHQGAVIVMDTVSCGVDATSLTAVSFSDDTDKLEVQVLGGSAGDTAAAMCQITAFSLNNQSGAIGSMGSSGSTQPTGIELASTVAFWNLIITQLGTLNINSASSTETNVFVSITGANAAQMIDYTGATFIAAAFTNSGDNIILACPIGRIKDAIAHKAQNIDAYVYFDKVYSATVGFSDQDNASLACTVAVGTQS